MSYGGHNFRSLSFSKDGKTLALAGSDSNRISIYDFHDDGSLTFVENFYVTYGYNPVSISPDGFSVVFGGGSSENIINYYPLDLNLPSNEEYSYKWNSASPYEPSLNDNAISFGNSELGSSYNLETHVLSGARVLVDGFVNIDNVA